MRFVSKAVHIFRIPLAGPDALPWCWLVGSSASKASVTQAYKAVSSAGIYFWKFGWPSMQIFSPTGCNRLALKRVYTWYIVQLLECIYWNGIVALWSRGAFQFNTFQLGQIICIKIHSCFLKSLSLLYFPYRQILFFWVGTLWACCPARLVWAWALKTSCYISDKFFFSKMSVHSNGHVAL